METWHIVVLTILVLVLLAVVVPQLPRKNRLLDAAGAKKPDKLSAMLDGGADPNAVGVMGITPLTMAILSGRLENARLLLERGADANGEFKLTHLEHAVATGDLQFVELLLEFGADPNRQGSAHRSAMLAAVEHGDPAILERLLEKGGDANGSQFSGDSLLTTAVLLAIGERNPSRKTGHRAVIELLLKHGANPNVRNAEDAPVLGLALNDAEILRLLVEHGAITDVAWDGRGLHDEVMSRIEEDA